MAQDTDNAVHQAASKAVVVVSQTVSTAAGEVGPAANALLADVQRKNLDAKNQQIKDHDAALDQAQAAALAPLNTQVTQAQQKLQTDQGKPASSFGSVPPPQGFWQVLEPQDEQITGVSLGQREMREPAANESTRHDFTFFP